MGPLSPIHCQMLSYHSQVDWAFRTEIWNLVIKLLGVSVLWGLSHSIQTFGSFYLIRTSSTLDELVSLVKVFRLNGSFRCSDCGHSKQMYNILSIGKGECARDALIQKIHPSQLLIHAPKSSKGLFTHVIRLAKT